MNYRSDIDGLRTIAVMLVILNHAGFSFFSGGFVGVDVFFVISGFLITSIIYPLLLNNNFSFTWFLSRRLKRLMPILLFVILISAIVFTIILLPQDLIKFYKSIIWVTLYAGNFFFWIEHGGYFDGGSQEAPLLHTWSLAVEEQYYLFWPLLLALAIKFFGKKGVLYFAVALCIAATVFSQWGTETTIGAAYYLLPTRFFELLAGSCLAIFWNKLPKLNDISSHLVSLTGLVLVITSAILLNEYSAFPGYNALYPVLGTALIIYASNGIVNKGLSFKPIVFTGNISYSLYLWHWPIFTFLRYTGIELTLPVQLLAIAITYVLSVASYKYIEQPFRYANITSFKQIAQKMYVIPTAFLIAMALIGIYYSGFPQRFTPDVVAMDLAVNSHASESRESCHSAFRDSDTVPNDKCLFGDSPSSKTQVQAQTPTQIDVFLFGDSHANHLVPFINALAEDAQLVGQDYTLDRCLPIFDLNWGSTIYLANKCKNRNNLALSHITNNNFKYIVLAASWPDYGTRRLFTDKIVTNELEQEALLKQKLTLTLNKIIATGAIPIIVADTPTLGGKSPKCPIKKALFNDELDCGIFENENRMFNKLTKQLRIEFPQLKLIKSSALFCKNGRCTMSLNGTPLYRDDDHLNEHGAKILADTFLVEQPNPLQ